MNTWTTGLVRIAMTAGIRGRWRDAVTSKEEGAMTAAGTFTCLAGTAAKRDGKRVRAADTYACGSDIWQAKQFGKWEYQTVGASFLPLLLKFLGWQVF